MTKKRFGFTLIELLIVVAIIAILAAIAVPNFLEAQTRAKVSRVKSDLRTMATAIESYYIDYNNPPPEARGDAANPNGAFGARTIDGKTGQTGILTPALSTPIAYLTNSDFRDVFFSNDGGARPDIQLFTWKAYKWEWKAPKTDASPIGFNELNALNGADFKRHYGAWRLWSVGPDRRWDNKPPNGTNHNVSSDSSVGLPYDATNGTLSVGSIIRSQAQADQKTWNMVNGQ
ncbi:hypothetical protein BH09SUM1_BH09SUM1_10040 [soil metagenome]